MPDTHVIDHDGWSELVLDRPARRNAITPEMVAGVTTALADLVGRGAPVLVLRGADGFFCSGLDLDVFAAGVPDGFGQSMQAMHVALFRYPSTIVGALEGAAINGGAGLALACDLLVAGAGATLRIAEIAQGLIAPMNIAWLAARTTESVAAQLVLTGRRVGAAELARLGLVAEVVDDADVERRAAELAATLAGYPAAGQQATKAALRALGPVRDPDEWFATPARHDPHRSFVPKRVTP